MSENNVTNGDKKDSPDMLQIIIVTVVIISLIILGNVMGW